MNGIGQTLRNINVKIIVQLSLFSFKLAKTIYSIHAVHRKHYLYR